MLPCLRLFIAIAMIAVVVPVIAVLVVVDVNVAVEIVLSSHLAGTEQDVRKGPSENCRCNFSRHDYTQA